MPLTKLHNTDITSHIISTAMYSGPLFAVLTGLCLCRSSFACSVMGLLIQMESDHSACYFQREIYTFSPTYSLVTSFDQLKV